MRYSDNPHSSIILYPANMGKYEEIWRQTNGIMNGDYSLYWDRWVKYCEVWVFTTEVKTWLRKQIKDIQLMLSKNRAGWHKGWWHTYYCFHKLYFQENQLQQQILHASESNRIASRPYSNKTSVCFGKTGHFYHGKTPFWNVFVFCLMLWLELTNFFKWSFRVNLFKSLQGQDPGECFVNWD